MASKQIKARAVKPLYYHSRGYTPGQEFYMSEDMFNTYLTYGIIEHVEVKAKEEKRKRTTKEQKL